MEYKVAGTVMSCPANLLLRSLEKLKLVLCLSAAATDYLETSKCYVSSIGRTILAISQQPWAFHAVSASLASNRGSA
jgi:hypothetical protein